MNVADVGKYYQPAISNSTPVPVSNNDYSYTLTSTIGGTLPANPEGLYIVTLSEEGVETIRNTNNGKQASYTLTVDANKLSQKFDIYTRYGVLNPQQTPKDKLINKTTVILDNRVAPVWTTVSDVSLNQGQTKTINLKDYITKFGEQTLFVIDGSLPAGLTLKDGVLTIASSALPQDKTVIKLKGYRNLSQGGKTSETSTSFKLTVIEKVNTEPGAANSPKILSVTNEITLDNAWSIYDNYHLYKVNGNAVNDAPVKAGKIVLPGKIDLSGLEAGTYSLYLYHSKTGGSEGYVVIKN